MACTVTGIKLVALLWLTQLSSLIAEIWTALKAACEAPDFDTCKVIIEAADIIVASPNMRVCYDQRGAKYDLPLYVLSDPENLVQDS